MRSRFEAVLLLLICFAGNSPGYADNLTVFSENEVRVYFDKNSSGYKLPELAGALEDFTRCFKQMTGVDLPALKTKDLIPLSLKLLAPSKESQLLDAESVQGYQIQVSSDRIVLSARTPLGLQNAIYHLLDHWGCRWIMIGKLGEVIPQKRVLTLPLGTIKSPKCFETALQAAGGTSTEVGNWWKRNQGGFEYWMTGQHYWDYALPAKTYYDEHPQWYALIAGKRVPTQLCTSNPEVIAKMIQVAKDFLKTRPKALSFPMDPNDNIDFCQCDRCRAQDPPGSDPMGLPLLTDRVLRFANEVAKGIAKEFPDRCVAFYAYNNHCKAPVNVKPEKNVAIIITRSNDCLLHYMPNEKCPSSLAFYDLVRSWQTITPSIYLYDYDPISWIGSLPCPVFMERTAALSLLFKEYGIKGGVTDYTPYFTKAYPATYINTYFERRVKSNPDRTPEEILTDMCESFFGPASKHMEKYYRELAQVADYQHPNRKIVHAGLYRYEELFNAKMINNARRYLNLALSVSADQPPFNERVRLIDLSQQYLEAYLDGMWSARGKNYKRTLVAFERVDTLINELDRVNGIDANDARIRLHAAKMKALAEYFPNELGMVRKWKLHGPFNNELRDAHMHVDEPMLVSSIDGWTNYTSPEGLLNMETILKKKNVPWKLSYMYAGVKVLASEEKVIQLRMDSFCPFRVYVNGQNVYYRPGLDADCPDKRIVQVTLKKGENIIVIKLSQTIAIPYAFPWGVYFRMTDLKGNPLESQMRN